MEHALRVAYVNRMDLSSLSKDGWDQPGIYILLSGDGSGAAYVGQARRLRQRLQQHDSKPKLPWDRAIAVKRDTTAGFNTAEIGYLEGRVSAELGATRRSTVVEGQKSGDETLPPHMQISLNAFVKSVLAALRLSGVDITRAEVDVDTDPVVEVAASAVGPQRRVLMVDVVGAGLLQAGETLHLKQGKVEEQGTVTPEGDIVVRGVAHSSPSAAAKSALRLQSSNGWTAWHVGSINGPTLDSLRSKWLDQQEEIAKARFKSTGRLQG